VIVSKGEEEWDWGWYKKVARETENGFSLNSFLAATGKLACLFWMYIGLMGREAFEVLEHCMGGL